MQEVSGSIPLGSTKPFSWSEIFAKTLDGKDKLPVR
jgi:hypothetical protein